jgi:hypothetical protein
MKIAAFVTLALGATLGALGSAPASAQLGNERALVVFGSDPCPRDTICVRAPETERYRIPKELRENMVSAGNERWADRAKSIEYAGSTGTASCSTQGSGSWTGCWGQMMKQAKSERTGKATNGADSQVP